MTGNLPTNRSLATRHKTALESEESKQDRLREEWERQKNRVAGIAVHAVEDAASNRHSHLWGQRWPGLTVQAFAVEKLPDSYHSKVSTKEFRVSGFYKLGKYERLSSADSTFWTAKVINRRGTYRDWITEEIHFDGRPPVKRYRQPTIYRGKIYD